MQTLVLVVAALLAQPGEFSGKVVSVHDGDTARVEKEDGTVINVRFTLCDAPEIGQPHGTEARDFVKEMCLGKQVVVKTEGTDDHDRTLGEIFVDDKSVNRELVRNGHAWWFYHYHADATDVGELEVQAKSGKKGLFASDTPIYPRNWRRGARVTGGNGGSGGTPTGGVFIMAVLPNPVGSDTNNETVILANGTNADVSLDQWMLVDDDGGEEPLSGTVPTGGTRTVRLSSALQLGNGGDKVSLKNAQGNAIQTVEYSSTQPGRFIFAD